MSKISLNLSNSKNSEAENILSQTSAPTELDPCNLLTCQVWKWHPSASNKSDGMDHSQPNPPDLTAGRIWLSKMITDKDELAFYEEYGWQYEYTGGEDK